VTTPLMSFHVAAHTECLPAPRLRALVGLLACVAVAMDTQTARPRKRLVTRRADVAILRLREGSLTGCTDVVVMLPQIRPRSRGRRHREWHRRGLESGGQRALAIHAYIAVVGLRGIVRTS
jgi:hypothetical protein